MPSKLSALAIPLAIVGAGALIASAIFFRGSIGSLPRSVGDVAPGAPSTTIQITACDGAESQQFSCLKKRYRELVLARDTDAAFSDLKTAYNGNPFIQSSCHQLTHIIGRAAAERYTDVATAFLHGDSFCWSGHYHGVMEYVSAQIGKEELTKKLPGICSSIASSSRYSFDHYNCVHGLGHGIMGVNSNELFSSLVVCDSLGEWWERESCYGGVFMENIMVDYNNETVTKYLKPNEPMYPCTAVETKYKQQCYLMQTSYALKVNNYNFKTVFAQCDAIEDAFRSTCYQSVGRDASGSTVSNIEGTYERCILGKDERAQSNCLIGAVKDFVSYHHSDVEAKKLCLRFDEPLRAMCLSTVIEYYKTF